MDQLLKPQMYLTAPGPCPYLPGKWERKLFTPLAGATAPAMNDLLTQAGFRRSQRVAYRPACQACDACLSVRVRARDFAWTKSFRRTWRANADLTVEERPARATAEQFDLLSAYLHARHEEGGMTDMGYPDYVSMVEESDAETRLFEYRDGEGLLTAVALTDRMGDGLSMVYTFFRPDCPKRSLGTHLILDHIDRAGRENNLHVYLGYWIEGCRKMKYKTRFAPIDVLGPDGWRPLRTDAPPRTDGETAGDDEARREIPPRPVVSRRRTTGSAMERGGA